MIFAVMVQELTTLKVGRIPFLVCTPFFHASLEGLEGVEFVDGVPKVLNTLLAAGKIDCAPSSSFEYARHSDRYLLLPGLCTSGKGEVKSVLFFSKFPWESLAKKRIRLSPESETSNVLFQILSQFKFQVAPELVLDDMSDIDGLVLIGDAALKESKQNRWPYRYDLAEVWETWQGTRLPFGLWMVRTEAWDKQRAAVLKYQVHLQQSLHAFFTDPKPALLAWNKRFQLPLSLPEALAFFPTADYELSLGHQKALQTFFDYGCAAHLLEFKPTLRFIESSLPQAETV